MLQVTCVQALLERTAKICPLAYLLSVPLPRLGQSLSRLDAAIRGEDLRKLSQAHSVIRSIR